MSALSLKTQVEEEKKEKKKSKRKYLFLCFTISENNDNFLNLSFKLITCSGTNVQVTNKPNNVFLFKKSLRRILFINM